MRWAWLAVGAALGAGCGPAAPAGPTVLAAASLTDAFGELEAAWEAEHPGADARLVLAGSQALALQARQGLRAEVFASADEAHARALVDEGLARDPRVFATNALVLAISPEADWPDGADLRDLPRLERIVVGDDGVPVGRYTAAFLDAAAARYGADWLAGVRAHVVSRESNVRLVAAKVAMGEADAAFVYATDVAAFPALRAVPLPADLAPAARYVDVSLVAGDAALADDWRTFLVSERGRAILAEHGFGAPP